MGSKTTFGNLQKGRDLATTELKVFPGYNLAGETMITYLPMYELNRMSMVANIRNHKNEVVAQRKLDMPHARKLAQYILKGIVSDAIKHLEFGDSGVTPDAICDVHETLGFQPYQMLQPIVANIRTCEPGGSDIMIQELKADGQDIGCLKIYLAQKDILWIIDGQHRRKAIELVFIFLSQTTNNQRYPAKRESLYPWQEHPELTPEEHLLWDTCLTRARSHHKIAVEMLLGLNYEEERQVFHDLNNLGKKVSSSLALEFDTSNPINLYIKNELLNNILNWRVLDKDRLDWNEDTADITYKDLAAINALLFLNKNNISGATAAQINPKINFANRVWQAISEIEDLGEPQAKNNTIAAQPVVLKAIAKLAYDFAFNARLRDRDNLNNLLDNLDEIDFSHDNPAWRYYELSEDEREEEEIDGMKDYLPPEDKVHNIGTYINKRGIMRFGSRHNDIVPVIGDMIRWHIGLPSRF